MILGVANNIFDELLAGPVICDALHEVRPHQLASLLTTFQIKEVKVLLKNHIIAFRHTTTLQIIK